MSSSKFAGPDYPASKKYVGEVAQGYLKRRDSGPSWPWEQAQVERYVRSRPGGRAVLDVPFGTGRYVPVYLEAGWHVHGCDISPDMIAESERALGPETFSRCDVKVAPAEQIPFPDQSMDEIVSSRFIQWLPLLSQVDRVIAEFGRVGRGGLFLQLRIPGEPRQTTKRPAESPLAYAKGAVQSLRRRLRPPAAPRAKIVTHPEPDLLAITERHGWRLEEIGVECPSSRGLRFYRFTKR